jgi:sedoheptulose-bisphosphatase
LHAQRQGDYGHDHVGTTNDFGDAQLHADVATDEVFFRHFTESRHVHIGSSEERPVEVDCVCDLPAEQGFSVAFDPLDGSSIVGANFAVGSIIGVWPGKGLLNRRGSEQVASMIAMYGPRVTVGVALSDAASASGEKIAFEVTMLPAKWILTTPRFVVAEECKTFAPGNLRATADHPRYKALVNYWIDHKYTLRYSGGLVPDVYHILHKGGGVLSNASSKSAKAKLRLLYECAPIALLVEAAGGASTACPSEAGEACVPGSVLDVQITDLDKRIGVCYGSKKEVARFIEYIFQE